MKKVKESGRKKASPEHNKTASGTSGQSRARAPSRQPTRNSANALRFSEKLSVAYHALDAEGRIIAVNRSWLRLLGHARSRVMGRRFADFMTPGSAAVLLRRFEHMKAAGEFHGVEYELVRKDGERVLVSVDGMVERDGRGRFRQTHCLVNDITGDRAADEALQQSEQRYFTLFEHSPVPLIEEDLSGVKACIDALQAGGLADLCAHLLDNPADLRRCLAAIRIINLNQAAMAYFKIGSKSALPADPSRFFHQESLPVLADVLAALSRGASAFEGELRAGIGPGDDRTVHFRLSLAPGSERTWSRVFFSFIDNTAQRSLEKKLRSYRRFTEVALNTLPEPFFVFDTEGKFLMWNRRATEVTGYSDEEFSRMRPVDFFPPDHAGRIREAIERVLRDGRASVEAELLARNGGRTAYEFLGGALRDVDGRTVGVAGFGRNISEQRHLLRDLGRYERIVSATPDLISLLDRDYVYRLVNDSYSTAHGKPREEIIGRSVRDLFGDAMFEDLFREKLERCLAGETISYETWLDFSGIGRRYTNITYYPYHEPDGAVSGVVVSVRDITDLKHAEDFVNDVLQSVDEGFIVIGPDLRIVAANKAYCDQVGRAREDVIGRFCYEVSHHLQQPCDESGEDCAVRRTFASGMPSSALHVHAAEDGSEHHVELKTFPLRDSFGAVTRVIEVVHDITEKRKLEAQLRHAQKMEAIGTLAGGIAHDFNNFLTVIMGYGSILNAELPQNAGIKPFVSQILSTAESAAHLVRRLLTFSRKQVMHVQPVDLNDIVGQLEKLLLRLVSEEIELRIERPAEELTILADQGQVEQVLMNLVSNAKDAMPAGGVITIATAVKRLGPEFEREHGFGAPGVYAVLAVSDTGVGIPDEDRQRIFEPFYTTKELGQGTGLGLSIVYGIVKQHNGYITVESEAGAGTAFHVYFPSAPSHATPESVPAPGTSRRGSETILVAEDDRNVRNLTCHILESSGYHVVEATDGLDAVRKFAEHQDSIALVLLDLLMPRKNGGEVLEEIRKVRPGVKALFFSGYGQDLVSRRGIAGHAYEFVEKPVVPALLLDKIRKLLDRGDH